MDQLIVFTSEEGDTADARERILSDHCLTLPIPHKGVKFQPERDAVQAWQQSDPYKLPFVLGRLGRDRGAHRVTLAAMSTPSIVTSFYDRIWNAGDLNAADELLANHFVFRGSLGVELRGREPFKDYASAVLQALGNYRCEILDCVTEQDRAFAKMRFGGIHRGVFRGFEPTGKPVQWHGAALFRIENGVIGELWVLGDLAGLDAMLKENANSASSTPPQELSSILRTSSTDPAQN